MSMLPEHFLQVPCLVQMHDGITTDLAGIAAVQHNRSTCSKITEQVHVVPRGLNFLASWLF